MITKLARLHEPIYRGIINLIKIYFCNNCLEIATKKACMK